MNVEIEMVQVLEEELEDGVAIYVGVDPRTHMVMLHQGRDRIHMPLALWGPFLEVASAIVANGAMAIGEEVSA